ncbi:YbaL family putative K(+) efflux transporter [Immundisolibacter sp.]|uniref:YbaL family putative K(+) efflux transporter n=1 Tax=Immundisolibacter sp. TaxID=1934948 RepID=UPI00262C9409|nr:YbaL family putative K(+) efflux transporter [Immundisolibacter sp.]MDD3650823.1 YbaL family putative K(+) efflux transporter [Immundisolibacter sp.]
MPHDSTLIPTLVIGLVFAFIGGFAVSKLRLPPLVGYLLAGVAVGPFTPGFVADQQLASELAEIGVILLMFGVGLHFSLKELLAVRRIAIPGAVGQIAVATALGAGIAHLWGWSLGAGLVFGLSLSVASTVVLLRALEQRGLLDSANGRIAIGWLIVEDLAMVLALVLLPALAGAPAAGHASPDLLPLLGWTLAKVGGFLLLVMVVGARVVPWLLAQVARTGSRELFTLAVLAVALGIAFGSAKLFGVSFALGAFFAGVVLSESDFSHRAAADSLPLQDAFAVLFFVSVGMLFDPSILVREPLAVLAVLAVIVVGKSLAACGIVLALGHPLSTALTVSASLAQIGEFSFILASLGVGLGLLPPNGRDLVLAGALLSITLNPLVFAAIGRLRGLTRRLQASSPVAADEFLPRELDTAPAQTRERVIVVGHGRVGRVVVQGLRAHGVPVVVIDHDLRRVEALRAAGVPAMHGNAAVAGLLDSAGAAQARLIVIATPAGYQSEQVIRLARALNPGVDIAVRCHSDAEVHALSRHGIGVALMAERELAFGLAHYALRSAGVSAAASESALDRLRRDVANDDTAPHEPNRRAPELRRDSADDVD